MITKMEKGQCLVCGGTVNYIDGTKEKFFFIVAEEEAKPERVVPLEKGKCLVLAGTISDAETLEEARERFRIAQETGKTPPRTKQATPYYVMVPHLETDTKSGLTKGEAEACNMFAQFAAKDIHEKMS